MVIIDIGLGLNFCFWNVLDSTFSFWNGQAVNLHRQVVAKLLNPLTLWPPPPAPCTTGSTS